MQQSSTRASGSRNTRPSGRLASGRLPNRGGIQKRNATPTRTDKDGDAVMGSTSGSRGGRGASIRGSAQKRRQGTPDTLEARISGRSARTRLDTSVIEKAVLRGVSSSDLPSRGSRVSARLSRNKSLDQNSRDGLEQLKVWGLKNSRVLSNPDGGVGDLIAFLERKATHSDSAAVKIKKVCLTVLSAGHQQIRVSRLSGPLSFQVNHSERRPRYAAATPG